VERGRKRGVGLTLANQRVARLKKNVLQPSLALFHRQTQDVDIARYAEMGIKRDEVLSLGNGDAYVFTDRVAKRRIHMRLRNSPHGANTPGIASIRGRNKTRNLDEISDDPESGSSFKSNEKPTSTFPSFPIGQNRATEVPPEMRVKIITRYANGMRRTAIRDELELNGDEYWMVRDVCDEYDRATKGVKA